MAYHLMAPVQPVSVSEYGERPLAEDAARQLQARHPQVQAQVQYSLPLADGGLVWTEGTHLHIQHPDAGELVVTVLGGWAAATALVEAVAAQEA